MFNKTHFLAILISLIAVTLIVQNYKMSQANKSKIVLYYADWCGICKMLMPEWNKFEDYIRKNLPNIEVQKKLCDDNNMQNYSFIAGFPTILLHKNNEIINFTSNRSYDELINFAETYA